MKKFVCLMIMFSAFLFSKDIKTPLEQNNYERLTSYNEMVQFLKDCAKQNSKIKIEYEGITAEKHKIPYVKISNDRFSGNKTCVLLFAQQHGNEPSGKEGMLFLLRDFVSGELDYLLKNLDFIIFPMINPDGAEKYERNNGLDMDLNRDHLLLNSPETAALHKVFNKYLPKITLDVHEYGPYKKEWEKSGYRKNNDEQFGTVTNPNVSRKIKNIQKKEFFPFIENYLNEKGYTFGEYFVGGPPETAKIRYSTADINDGRQSFAILGTFSMILEGKNGKYDTDNIKHRAIGQYYGIRGYCEFVNQNSDKIIKAVDDKRNRLTNSEQGDEVVIKIKHVKSKTGVTINLFLLSLLQDVPVTIKNFYDNIKPVLSVSKPAGYLVPKDDKLLHSFLLKHDIKFEEYKKNKNDRINLVKVNSIDSLEEEEMFFKNINEENILAKDVQTRQYYFIPVNQLRSDLVSIALEPQSMFGLAQTGQFKYLLKTYPILKVYN